MSFKATHNSYHLPDRPDVQIDRYDVWEIELDFGVGYDSPDFVVGHDCPEPKHGLYSLGDWVRCALDADSLTKHPLILKLEAKTHELCGQLRFPSFKCVDDWGVDWQARLADSLTVWIGHDRWVTPTVYREELEGEWPEVAQLAGRVIVTLQDSNDDKDIDSTDSRFFGRDIPGLTAAWPPIDDESSYRKSLAAGVNRLIMDGGYRETWSLDQ